MEVNIPIDNHQVSSLRTICLLVKRKPIEQVLLGYKKIGFGKGKYTGVGGKLEAGESAREAAARELVEEIEVQVKPQDLIYRARLTFIFPYRPKWSQIDFVFLVEHWQGVPCEGLEVVPCWFEFEQLPYDLMWDDARIWLPSVLAGNQLQMQFAFSQDNEHVEKVAVVDSPINFTEVNDRI